MRKTARISIGIFLLQAIASGQVDLAQLTAPDGQLYDDFGASVSLGPRVSGQAWAIVGAPDDDDLGNRSGSAYIFDSRTARLRFKLTAPKGAAEDFFGSSVAISRDHAIVGAMGDDDVGNGAGSVHVFDVATGAPLWELHASDGAAGHQFGRSVSLAGDLALIGAPTGDGLVPGSGAAYVFDLQTGQQLFKLQASDGELWDSFGVSVSVSGTLAIIGARYENALAHESGSAYVFDLITGQQLFKLTASDGGYRREFGTSVALDGRLAIVGSPWDDSVAAGSAYVFDATTGKELFVLSPSDGVDGKVFGYSVSISGERALVGAWGDDHAGWNTGSAYLYDVKAGEQLVKLAAPQAEQDDYYGFSVGLIGDLALVGAFGNEGGAAHVIDVRTVGQVFCRSTPNSTGLATGLEATGSSVARVDNLTLRAFDMPPNVPVLFLVSDSSASLPAAPPHGGGKLCVGASNIGRFLKSPAGQSIVGDSGLSGEYSISTIDGDWTTTEMPARNGGSYAAMAGTSAYFQAWHRDAHPTNPGAPWAQLSQGLEILWH